MAATIQATLDQAHQHLAGLRRELETAKAQTLEVPLGLDRLLEHDLRHAFDGLRKLEHAVDNLRRAAAL